MCEGVSETGRHCMIQSLLGSTVSGQTQEAEEREQRRRKGTGGREGRSRFYL